MTSGFFKRFLTISLVQYPVRVIAVDGRSKDRYAIIGDTGAALVLPSIEDEPIPEPELSISTLSCI